MGFICVGKASGALFAALFHGLPTVAQHKICENRAKACQLVRY
jgi:hypothetical protein